MNLSLVPVLTITSPENGDIVNTDQVNLSGMVRSSLPPEEIRVVFDGNVVFPTGTGGDYAFLFTNVQLIEGPNTLTVKAETIHGSVTANTTVTYSKIGEEEEDLPILEIHSITEEYFTTEDSIEISGTAESDLGIQSVTVNNDPVTLEDTGSIRSFSHTVSFDGQETLPIEVTATDNNGGQTKLNFTAVHDTTAPVITLTDGSLLPSPQVNAVNESPYTLSGTITEKYLSGLTINGQSVAVTATGTEDQWNFSTDLLLTRGVDTPITIEVTDRAGNIGVHEIVLNLESALDITILAPTPGAEYISDAATLDISV
jgi:outer membrane lipoprotein-sorting protein